MQKKLYSCRIKEHSNKSPILAISQVYTMIKIQPNSSDLDLPTPKAFCIGVASQWPLEPPDQEDYNHGSTVTQPSLPLSTETNVILATKASSSVTKHQEIHSPRQSLNKKALLPVAGACGAMLAPTLQGVAGALQNIARADCCYLCCL